MGGFNVVLATDQRYLPYAEIMLKSVLSHHQNIAIFILSFEEIDLEWINTLRQLCEYRQSALFFVQVDKPKITLKEQGYISQSTYLRYYIEHLFPVGNGNRWLYLDCDLVVNGDISQPFLLPEFEQYPLMAVLDPYMMTQADNRFKQGDYFNAGVLYINAEKWGKCGEILLALTDKYRSELAYGDQDILNLFFYQKWYALSREYNLQTTYLEQEIIENAKILHFTGKQKPWNCDMSTTENICHYNAIFHFYRQLDWFQAVTSALGAVKNNLL